MLSPVLTFAHTGRLPGWWGRSDPSLLVDQTQPNTGTAVLLLPAALVVLPGALVLPGVLAVPPAPRVAAVAVVPGEGIGCALLSLPASHDGLGPTLGPLGGVEEEGGEDGDAEDDHG